MCVCIAIAKNQASLSLALIHSQEMPKAADSPKPNMQPVSTMLNADSADPLRTKNPFCKANSGVFCICFCLPANGNTVLFAESWR